MFRPEFLNRIDETVIFKRLVRDEIRQIVDLQLNGLRARIGERRLDLEATPEALDALAAEGYDPAFGARPLKRVVQRLVENPLAMMIVDGQVGDGTVVRLEAGDGDAPVRVVPAGAREEAAQGAVQ
jgi:ATP-dependent Clp protease ATP-binding subunit ClpA